MSGVASVVYLVQDIKLLTHKIYCPGAFVLLLTSLKLLIFTFHFIDVSNTQDQQIISITE